MKDKVIFSVTVGEIIATGLGALITAAFISALNAGAARDKIATECQPGATQIIRFDGTLIERTCLPQGQPQKK